MGKYECPTCSDTFDTEKGKNTHHTMAHGESIAKQESECDSCGDVFSYYPSNKTGVMCPDCVESGENYRRTDQLTDGTKPGSANPNWSGGRSVDCDHCGESVYKSPSKLNNRKNHFCDKDCSKSFFSDKYKKDGNPNWKGGYDSEYGYGWWSTRKAALERDKYTCQSCGKSKKEIGRNPDVHHIQPVRSFENKKEAHTLDNVICLCRQCHSELEGITERFKLLRRLQ